MLVQAGERLDDLQRNGLRIIQSEDAFCFSIDAVLLSHFATVKNGDAVVDLGTGSGVIPLLLSTRASSLKITGLELNEVAADRARRSVEINALEQCITIVQGDLREMSASCAEGNPNLRASCAKGNLNLRASCARGKYNLVLCNPPYLPQGIGATSVQNTRRMARHEITATLSDVVSASAYLLSTGGRFAMVHRPFRLADIMCALREHNLEPKRLRMVHPTAGSEANMVLVEAIKDSKPALRVGQPIFVHENDGGYTAQILELYAGGALR